MLCLVTQSCLTLCDRTDYSLPSSSVHGLLSPGKSTGVCSHSLLQGIFLIQELDLFLLHWRRILYCWSHQGDPPEVMVCSYSEHPTFTVISHYTSSWALNPAHTAPFHIEAVNTILIGRHVVERKEIGCDSKIPTQGILEIVQLFCISKEVVEVKCICPWEKLHRTKHTYIYMYEDK